MQRLFLSFFALFLSFALPIQEAEAKRLGGGKSYGMQRDAPMKRDASPNQSQNPTQNQAQNSAAPNAAGAAAQPGKRSWMGPVAGLAAGLGLAALASHLGFGEEMANFLMIALLALAAFMLFRWFMRRNQPQAAQYAGATTGASPNASQPARFESNQALPGSVGAMNGGAAQRAAPDLPPGFDAEAFTRQAKVNFLRLQAANDAGNLDDIREFTSPEMFAEIKLDIDDRRGATQRTEVITLDAEVLEAVEEGGRQIVSVRFHGMLREDSEQTEHFDEVWHLARPADARSGWVIAGIQQNA